MHATYKNLICSSSALGEFVEKRTEELQIVNAELKTFAYTVSHDLKTPLRAIHGFAEILQENYSDKQDSESRLYLQRSPSHS